MHPTLLAAVAILLLARALPAQHAGHAGATAADSAGTGMRHEGMETMARRGRRQLDMQNG